jgi:cation-transporting ATPase 13A2
MIQFMTVVILYQIGSNLSDGEFLYEDLFIIIPLCFLMGATEPYPELTPELPEESLIGFPTIISVVISTGIQLAF